MLLKNEPFIFHIEVFLAVKSANKITEKCNCEDWISQAIWKRNDWFNRILEEKKARPIEFHKRAHRERSRGGHLWLIGIMSPEQLNNYIW